MSEKLLAERSLKTQRVKVMSTGLYGIEEGLKMLQDGKVSGEKLVY